SSIRTTVTHCGLPARSFHMNLALLMRSTLPGGNQVLFSGWVSSHSTSQAVSHVSGWAGSKRAAGKPCLTTLGGTLAVGVGGGGGGGGGGRGGGGGGGHRRGRRAPAGEAERAQAGRDQQEEAPGDGAAETGWHRCFS